MSRTDFSVLLWKKPFPHSTFVLNSKKFNLQNYFYKIIQERFNIQENKNGTPSSVEYFFKRLGGVVEHLCPAGIYLLKVNNRNTRKKCGICSKLTTMTPEWRHWHRSSVFRLTGDRWTGVRFLKIRRMFKGMAKSKGG